MGNVLKQKHVQLERYIMLFQLKNYIKKGCCFLEIGAGARCVINDIQNKYIQVTSVDKNEEKLQFVKAEANKVCGNILRLHMFSDNVYDVVFVNGPMSHLFVKAQQKQAIKEAMRVCKPNGVIIFNFLTVTPWFIRYGLLKGNLPICIKKMNKHYKPNFTQNDKYMHYDIQDFRSLCLSVGLKHVKDVATDGPFEILKEHTNLLDEKTFEGVKQWQKVMCEKPEMLGFTTHCLGIYKK